MSSKSLSHVPALSFSLPTMPHKMSRFVPYEEFTSWKIALVDIQGPCGIKQIKDYIYSITNTKLDLSTYKYVYCGTVCSAGTTLYFFWDGTLTGKQTQAAAVRVPKPSH